MTDSRAIVVVSLILALVSSPPSSHAQAPGKIPRVGYLSPGSPDPVGQQFVEAFRQGLRALGYQEGRNVVIEVRWADEKYDRLPRLAAELVGLKVDVLVARASPAIRAAKAASETIPIVMVNVVDPVATGFVASLSRPGGNITRVSMMAPDIVGKQLELLREVAPKSPRVAVLWNPANPSNPPQLRAAERAARALGIPLQALAISGPQDIDSAFVAMRRERTGAFIVFADPVLTFHRTRLSELAARDRLPTISFVREIVEAGGLMSYGASLPNLHRRAAIHVDRILKGAKPADLPVEQPTKFELVINLKTAKTLGLTIPSSLLSRADEIITR